jgi:hypothetical protein
MPRRPSTGWYIEVDLPGGQTVTVDPLDDPEYRPNLNDLPRVDIPVAPADRWQTDAILNQPCRVVVDGYVLPIDEIEARDEQSDRVVLTAVGGVQLLTYIDDEAINNEYTHEAVRRLIPDRTGYSVDVRQPDAQRYDDNIILQKDSDTTNADNLKPLADDDPIHVNSNDKLDLLDSCWFVEAEDVNGDFSFQTTNTDEWSDNSAALLDDDNTFVEYTFTTDYPVPKSQTQVSFLVGVPANSFNNFEAEARLNGSTYRTFQDEDFDKNGQFDTYWVDTSPDSDFSGSETVRFEMTDSISSDAEIYIDAIAPLDDDYEYTFDTADGDDPFIKGPETKPDLIPAETVTVDLIQTAVGGRLDVSIDDTSGDQQLGVRNDPGDGFTTASNSDTVATDFTDQSRQITGRVTLARYGSRSLPSPTTGFRSQTVSDLTLKADLKPLPALVDEHPRATLLEALQGWADDGDYVWQVQRDQSAVLDDRDGYTVKMARAGQLAGDAPGDVVTYQGSETDREAYERVEVFGSSTRARATVSQPTEGVKIGVGRENYHVVGSERVFDDGADPSPNDPADYERRRDYEYDYNRGAITNLAGPGMSESDDFVILYRHNHRGTAAVDNPSNPSENTLKTEFPTAETENQCALLARQLLRQVDSPGQDLRVTVDLEDPSVDLVQALSFAPINLDGPLQIREARYQPGEVQYRLRRQRVSEIVDRLRSRAAQLAERTE